VPIKSTLIVYYVWRKAQNTLVRGFCCGTQGWSPRFTTGTPDKGIFTGVRTQVSVFETEVITP